jgi:polyphosphate kinase 2 (PPK2 family)
LQLSKQAQGRRLQELSEDPETAWRVTDADWHHHRIYDTLGQTARRIRELTNRPGARWTVIDAEDERRRDLLVGELLLAQFTQQQKNSLPEPAHSFRRTVAASFRLAPLAGSGFGPGPVREGV